jgi:hypothetical protein
MSSPLFSFSLIKVVRILGRVFAVTVLRDNFDEFSEVAYLIKFKYFFF